MDVNLAWAVAALFLGAFLTRWNAVRQHAAEVHAAREQAFEAMQRDTWLALQNALVEMHRSLADAKHLWVTPHREVEHAVISWLPEPAHDDPVKAARDREVGFADFQRAHLTAVALRSRLVDSVARQEVTHAITGMVNLYMAIAEGRPRDITVESIEDRLTELRSAAVGAVLVAMERLGVLISQRPEPPKQPWRWPRLGRQN